MDIIVVMHIVWHHLPMMLLERQSLDLNYVERPMCMVWMMWLLPMVRKLYRVYHSKMIAVESMNTIFLEKWKIEKIEWLLTNLAQILL